MNLTYKLQGLYTQLCLLDDEIQNEHIRTQFFTLDKLDEIENKINYLNKKRLKVISLIEKYTERKKNIMDETKTKLFYKIDKMLLIKHIKEKNKIKTKLFKINKSFKNCVNSGFNLIKYKLYHEKYTLNLKAIEETIKEKKSQSYQIYEKIKS